MWGLVIDNGILTDSKSQFKKFCLLNQNIFFQDYNSTLLHLLAQAYESIFLLKRFSHCFYSNDGGEEKKWAHDSQCLSTVIRKFFHRTPGFKKQTIFIEN